MKRGENLRKYDHSGPTYRTRPDEYRAWAGMKTRCLNPEFKDWNLYGGRGITVCPKWSSSFVEFFRDMGPRPSPLHSLDRKDSDGNYEPGNCRWATAIEQRHNQRPGSLRAPIWITFNGSTKMFHEWATWLRISQASLRERIAKWGIERALVVPAVRLRRRNEKGRYAPVSD